MFCCCAHATAVMCTMLMPGCLSSPLLRRLMHLVIMPHDMPADIGNEKGEREKWEGKENVRPRR